MKAYLFAAVGGTLCLAVSLFAADIKLEGVKCIMNPKAAAKADKSVDYKGGKVFFCCDNCPKAFAKDTAKHATQANLQLVATGQAKQQHCPLSGGDLNPATKIKVGGVDVCFCCEKCQAKATEAKDAAVELIFSDKAFDKGFKVSK